MSGGGAERDPVRTDLPFPKVPGQALHGTCKKQTTTQEKFLGKNPQRKTFLQVIFTDHQMQMDPLHGAGFDLARQPTFIVSL
jgi:hypothetical protein